VFFLAGYLDGSTPVSRTIVVPDGKPVFFPVINDFYVPINQTGAYSPDPPCVTLTLACALQAPYLTQVEDLAVQIDGISLDNAQIDRQTSPSYFSVTLPADNVLGVTSPSEANGCCANLWTQDGFYITLDDLSVGTHVLHFEGEGSSLAGGSFSQDVMVTLVVVPEPSTWAMMSIGFAGLGFAAYRKRRTQRPPVAVPPRTTPGWIAKTASR
jgi:PEP-CTERM motif